MDPKKDQVLPVSPPQIQGQPGGVVREREGLASFENPIGDPEVAKIVQVNPPDPANEPPINFPAQTVKVEINEPKIPGGSSMSKAEAQTIIRTFSPDDSKRGKAVIIVREEDRKEEVLGSKNAF